MKLSVTLFSENGKPYIQALKDWFGDVEILSERHFGDSAEPVYFQIRIQDAILGVRTKDDATTNSPESVGGSTGSIDLSCASLEELKALTKKAGELGFLVGRDTLEIVPGYYVSVIQDSAKQWWHLTFRQ